MDKRTQQEIEIRLLIVDTENEIDKAMISKDKEAVKSLKKILKGAQEMLKEFKTL